MFEEERLVTSIEETPHLDMPKWTRKSRRSMKRTTFPRPDMRVSPTGAPTRRPYGRRRRRY
ncbi:MAG: hypothetical protein ACETWE_05775 [Candidatus Bathyarchaeia archaeon]